MCGAMGTLGPLTEVTLRVFPKPSLSKIFALHAKRDVSFMLLRKVWSSAIEATGLACTNAIAFIRLEGSAESMMEKAAMLHTLVETYFVEACDDAEVFQRIASGRMFGGAVMDLWRAVLPPSRAAEISRLDTPWVSDWAGGLHWISATPGLAADDLQRWLATADGGCTLVCGSKATRARAHVFPVEPTARAELTRRVKAAFDPLRLFNPGRMWEGV
jgi:glycolate oxidase FAD binding subunit